MRQIVANCRQCGLKVWRRLTRDRSHASVWVWNFCNEVNCNTDPIAATGMKNVTTTFDGTRPVTMNHIVDGVALQTLDIQVGLNVL